MLGAIAGDLIGSGDEARPVKTNGFDPFPPEAHVTVDGVLAVAAAWVCKGATLCTP